MTPLPVEDLEGLKEQIALYLWERFSPRAKLGYEHTQDRDYDMAAQAILSLPALRRLQAERDALLSFGQRPESTLLTDLMEMWADPEMDGLTYRAAKEIARLEDANQAAEARMEKLREALERIASFTRIRPAGNPGSYQRGYDIGFNNAGLAAAGFAQTALKDSSNDQLNEDANG